MPGLGCKHTTISADTPPPPTPNRTPRAPAASITQEDVNAVARTMMSFASHYGSEGQLLEEAAADPEGYWAWPGPTRCACVCVS